MTSKYPTVLFKYRPFSPQTLHLLCSDLVYYADPSTFNDPLDTKPCVEIDCDIPTLQRTVYELVRRRVETEMRVSARAIKYRGPKTLAHIDKHSRAAAKHTLDTLNYHATDPEWSEAPPAPLIQLLGSEIERELLLQYERGILSLAKRFDCPLMWSHYGDQHRGICLGYQVPPPAQSQLHQVRYGGRRTVRASAVAAMLQGDKEAREAVDEAVLLRKAQAWRYEKEWRHLGPRGTCDSPLELVELLFGTRCDGAVKHAITTALIGRDSPVHLYEMYEVHGTFKLKRRLLDVAELSVSYPRRALSIAEAFESAAVADDQNTKS